MPLILFKKTNLAAAIIDIYWNNVTLLINGETGLVDMSGNNVTITPAGGATTASTHKYGSYGADFTGTKSATFDGTNVLDFGASDFTVEFWMNPAESTAASKSGVTYAQCPIIDGRLSSNLTGAYFMIGRGQFDLTYPNKIYVWCNNTLLGYSTSTPALNTWTHVAYTRQGTTGRLFINGVLEATWTDSITYIGATGAKLCNNMNSVVASYAYARTYLDDVRVTKGFARYTGNFTPTGPYPTSNGGITYDPFWSNVATYLRFEGSDGSTTFTDDVAGRSWTATNGFPVITTAAHKYGSSSLKMLPTSAGTLRNNQTIDLGTGDYTIEFFVMAPFDAVDRYLYDTTRTGGTRIYCHQNNGYLAFSNGSTNVTSTIMTADGNWHHIAFVKRSGISYLFVDGVQNANSTKQTTTVTLLGLDLGGYGANQYMFNGYLDEFKITKGIAKYTTKFTPPTGSALG